MELVVWGNIVLYLIGSIGASRLVVRRRPHISRRDEAIIVLMWIFLPTLISTGIFAWSGGELGLLRLLDGNRWLATVYWYMLCSAYVIGLVLGYGIMSHENGPRLYEVVRRRLGWVYPFLPLTSWAVLIATALLLGDGLDRLLPYGSPDGIDYRLVLVFCSFAGLLLSLKKR